VIPGVNSTCENMDAMIGFLKSLRAFEQVELIPFHKMASVKYDSLDMEYTAGSVASLGPHELEDWVAYFTRQGIRTVAS
jgi:pyruvate formate lyase activating enzyme